MFTWMFGSATASGSHTRPHWSYRSLASSPSVAQADSRASCSSGGAVPPGSVQMATPLISPPLCRARIGSFRKTPRGEEEADERAEASPVVPVGAEHVAHHGVVGEGLAERAERLVGGNARHPGMVPAAGSPRKPGCLR